MRYDALVYRSIAQVPPIPEISEVTLDQGMLNRQAAVIWFEILFGYIRLMLGFVWQNVIPRTVFGWPRTGRGFVPLLGSPKVRIDADNHAPVIEQFVLHHVSN